MKPVGIGHNNGPSMDPLRIHRWGTAKAALPRPAPAVARMWLARAQALGMAPGDYFAFRAASGRDLAGVIFTQGGLNPGRGPWPARLARLAALPGVRCGLLLGSALDTDLLATLDITLGALPPARAAWQDRRAAIRDLLARMGSPAGGTLLVSDGPQDLMTMQAGGLADLWPPHRFFAEPDPLAEPARAARLTASPPA